MKFRINYLNYILLFIVVIIVNACVTLFIINKTKEPSLKFAVINSEKISSDLNEYMNENNLTEKERTQTIKQYSINLVNTVSDYEKQTGTIVLKKSAVAVPNHHDITSLIQKHVKR